MVVSSLRPSGLDVKAVAARRRVRWEIALLLGVSLGRSAVSAVIELVGDLTDSVPLGEQIATLNPVRSPRPYLDLAWQLHAVIFGLVPVGLALYFLAIRPNSRPLRESLGLDWRLAPRNIVRDLLWGISLFSAVAIPGLLFYILGRALGITVAVQPSGLTDYWWTIPILLLQAFRNGAVEEVIVVGYLYRRTQDIGWSQGGRIDLRFLITSALLRGSYHLYQGIGPFIGNFAMGLFFAWWFQSRFGNKRVLPLVIAHTLIDAIVFVGAQLAPAALLRLLGLAT